MNDTFMTVSSASDQSAWRLDEASAHGTHCTHICTGRGRVSRHDWTTDRGQGSGVRPALVEKPTFGSAHTC